LNFVILCIGVFVAFFLFYFSEQTQFWGAEMRRNFSLILLLVLIAFSNCRNGVDAKKYFVISKDSVCMATERYKNNDLNDRRNILISPPPFPSLGWYSDLVIIFDSTDRVYLYQTKKAENSDSTIMKDKERIGLSKFPPFIGLQPFHLLTFKSEDFINFIKSNNDILKLDSTNIPGKRRFVYIVSNKDTIENNAYYQFINLIRPKSDSQNFWPVSYMIRITTEEENYAIYYKRKGETYLPNSIKWSENFIIGKCRPLTGKYDSIEKRLFFVIKANETYGAECTRLPKML